MELVHVKTKERERTDVCDLGTCANWTGAELGGAPGSLTWPPSSRLPRAALHAKEGRPIGTKRLPKAILGEPWAN